MSSELGCVSQHCYVLYTAVWYGIVYVNLYSALVANVANALRTLVPRKQPSFQALFEGAKVLLCADCGGRQAKSSKPSGHAQRMLGSQQ